VQARFEVAMIDPASGRAVVDWRQVVDSRGTGQALGDSVKQLGEDFGRPPSIGQSYPNPTLSIRYECRYLLEMRSGWVNDLKHLQVIRSPDGSSTEESLRIRRIDSSSRRAPAGGPTRQGPMIQNRGRGESLPPSS